jgi:hypothetical protein
MIGAVELDEARPGDSLADEVADALIQLAGRMDLAENRLW